MKKTLLYFCLSLLIAVLLAPCDAFSQIIDQEKLHVGYRCKPGQVMTVYADYQGEPNPYQYTLLTNRFYFQLEGSYSEGCPTSKLDGVVLAKIWIPGSADQNAAAGNANEPDGRDVEKRGCDARFPKNNPLPPVLNESLLGKLYWIPIDQLCSEEFVEDATGVAVADLAPITDAKINSGKLAHAYLYSRFFASVLAVPFKYRFSFSEKKSAITAESSVGSCIGIKLGGSRYFDQNVWLIGGGGLTLINPNTIYDDPNTAKKPTQAGAFFCFGLAGNIGKTQFGVVGGYDFADPAWEYHAKPWVAFSVGFAFLSRDPKNITQ